MALNLKVSLARPILILLVSLLISIVFEIGTSHAAYGLSSELQEVGFWQFDVVDGSTIIDSSGYQHHGVSHGNPTATQGIFSGALLFDGVDDYVAINDSENLQLSDAITLSTWIAPQLTDQTQAIIDFGQYALKIRPDFRLFFKLRIPGANDAITAGWVTLLSSSLSVQRWTHVATTYDVQTRLMRIYINGQLDAEKQITGGQGLISSTASLERRISSPFEPFTGAMDEVRIYRTALERETVKYLARDARPNIILVMADDVGYESIGAYGGISYSTPNIDSIAAEGMRFEHAYSQPTCTPSRVKIMTGKYNFRNYIQFAQLAPGETTFANLLQSAGYQTLVAGKWQLAASGGQDPTGAGFDEHVIWDASCCGVDSRYGDPTIQTNNAIQSYPGLFGPDIFKDYVVDFLGRNHDGPFFVYYPMVLPHVPFVATPDRPDADTGDKRFAAMVAYLDKIVGDIVVRLNQLGIRDNTLLLFTTDNGGLSPITSQLADGTSVTGGKAEPTDAGTRVPFIVNWPGTVPAGLVNSNIIDFSVVLPTLTTAGLSKTPIDLDGYSLLPELLGETGSPRGSIYVYHEPKNDYWPDLFDEFTRDIRFKYYRNGEFYDMEVDVLEQNPIPEGTGDVVAEAARTRLKGILNDIRPPVSVDSNAGDIDQ